MLQNMWKHVFDDKKGKKEKKSHFIVTEKKLWNIFDQTFRNNLIFPIFYPIVFLRIVYLESWKFAYWFTFFHILTCRCPFVDICSTFGIFTVEVTYLRTVQRWSTCRAEYVSELGSNNSEPVRRGRTYALTGHKNLNISKTRKISRNKQRDVLLMKLGQMHNKLESFF